MISGQELVCKNCPAKCGDAANKAYFQITSADFWDTYLDSLKFGTSVGQGGDLSQSRHIKNINSKAIQTVSAGFTSESMLNQNSL
eukprot:1169147-Amphidinium_carterae.1